MNIQITDRLSTGQFLLANGHPGTGIRNDRCRERERFLDLLDRLYVNGMCDKRFLDCGCNAGGYCFWARERHAEIAYGFDAREHWIKQARFLKRHRTVGINDRIQFEVLNLYDLPEKNLDPFELVQFRGLFSHLSDPIGGLKIAADLARDTLIFATSFVTGREDGALISSTVGQECLHGGVEKMAWLPTGPHVCAEIIRNLGFDEVKLTKIRRIDTQPDRGRITLIAARDKHRLQSLPGRVIGA